MTATAMNIRFFQRLNSKKQSKFGLGNFTSSLIDRLTATGGATAASTYTDRPTVVYQPLTGEDFVKRLLGLTDDLRACSVYFGGYSGKDKQIAMNTRSMLQIMLEFAAIVRVPEADVVQGKATPGLVDIATEGAPTGPPLRILVADKQPPEPYGAPRYHRN